ncbi:polyribonucleotide nucleotidyltransferase [Candidatus Microgenomates bacterium]|nr:polyribonucleotide nucleotidyltransferase [Candidatus Microgenomates bacterium]
MSDIIHPFGGKHVKLEAEFCGRPLSIETGHLAFLADGAVTVRYGDTVVLGTAAITKTVTDFDFLPLTIEYEERMYAAGKISGSRFIKREGRASERATLAARLIDRPVRPLWPKGYRNEIQGIATILSADLIYSPDIIAMIAISSALMLTGAPFAGPIAGIKIGMTDGKLIPYATNAELEEGKLDLTLAGTKDAILMVEAGAKEVDEDTVVKALELAHQSLQPVIKLQEELVKKVGVKPQPFEVSLTDEQLTDRIDSFLQEKLGPAVRHESSYERHRAIDNLREETLVHFANDNDFGKKDIAAAFEEAIKREVRRSILEEGDRPDNRKYDQIRPLSSMVGVLPRTHGSAIFTRGTTQVLNVTTLAPPSYSQTIDTMEEDTTKRFMHHYNFPPYSTGEVRQLRTSRREIGHGALAERALEAVLPPESEFPYAIRSVSEVVTSNGSTSMASVCAGTLSLMDAGVPITKPVSGIAMGLITDDKKHVILSDIAGDEDFAGDMDFKVAGTKDGITALQMDIKIKGLDSKLMAEALAQAKTGRAHIMEHLISVLPTPRDHLAATAPRITSIKINPEKIRVVIGKGGETINRIIAETGAEIDIHDDGTVIVSSIDQAGSEQAIATIEALTTEPKVGQVYEGTVVKTLEFGAFVEILPGKEGLVHISELADHHVAATEDEVKQGDKIKVKLVGVDDRGRLRLSKKAAEAKE